MNPSKSLRNLPELLVVRNGTTDYQRHWTPRARTTLATERISSATRSYKPSARSERFASSPRPISLVLATVAMRHGWNGKSVSLTAVAAIRKTRGRGTKQDAPPARTDE